MAAMESKKIFTYGEALESFPVVHKMTRSAVRQVEAMYNQVQSLDESEDRREQLESTFQGIVRRWAARVVGLGCEVKGVWLVDWDCGHGYYCWKYPEETLSHFHDYDEGFQGRVPVN